MDYETIILQKEEAVATITLNRPDKLNALSPKMGQELIDVFRAVDEDDDVRVVLITGSGRAFCAGADIQETFLDKIEEKKKGAVIDATRISMSSVHVPCHRCENLLLRSSTGLPSASAAPSPWAVISGLRLKMPCLASHSANEA